MSILCAGLLGKNHLPQFSEQFTCFISVPYILNVQVIVCSPMLLYKIHDALKICSSILINVLTGILFIL